MEELKIDYKLGNPECLETDHNNNIQLFSNYEEKNMVGESYDSIIRYKTGIYYKRNDKLKPLKLFKTRIYINKIKVLKSKGCDSNKYFNEKDKKQSSLSSSWISNYANIGQVIILEHNGTTMLYKFSKDNRIIKRKQITDSVMYIVDDLLILKSAVISLKNWKVMCNFKYNFKGFFGKYLITNHTIYDMITNKCITVHNNKNEFQVKYSIIGPGYVRRKISANTESDEVNTDKIFQLK